MKSGLWIDKKTFIPFSESARSLSEEIATRSRSIDFYSLSMYLPNPDPVLKKMGKDISVYRDIMADARVGAGVINRKAGVKSLEWEIDRGKAKSRPAKVIDSVFKNLDMERIIGEILDAVLFGYQPLEVLWEKRGGLILPKDVIGKPPEWFVFGPENNELRFRTKSNWNGEDVPEKKFLLPRVDATYQNPYGSPALSRCFWPVTFKKGGWKFWVTFTEKFGMPFLVGKVPRGTGQTEIDKLADTLEQMIQDAIAVIPDDSSIETMGAGGKSGGSSSASSDLYDRLIAACNSEISTALLGHAGTSESTPGKLGSEDAALTVREEIVDGDKKLVCSTLNQLIAWIYEYNFTGGERPEFGLWEEEDVDKTLAERDELLTKTGVKFTKKYFIKTYALEEEDLADDTAPPEPVQGSVRSALPNSQETSTGSRASKVQSLPSDQSRAFAERKADTLFPDQQAIDDAAGAMDPKILQAQMEGILKPIIDLINQGHSPEAVMGKLAETFPDMDSSALEEMLSRAIFVSEIWGRLHAK